MKINDLNDSNEVDDTNEMKMIEKENTNSANATKKYVLKNEIFEDENMKESEENTDSEFDEK
jgi:hypothetical protein